MRTQADAKKAKFDQPEGDHLTLLATYDGWKAGGFSDAWCEAHFIQVQHMCRARDVRKQLVGIMERYGHDVVSAAGRRRGRDRVRRAICAGFFRHAVKRDPRERRYKTPVERAVQAAAAARVVRLSRGRHHHARILLHPIRD